MKKAKNNSLKYHIKEKFQLDVNRSCAMCCSIKNKKFARLVKYSLLHFYSKICISISIVGELESKNLNQTWRDKNKATNVLSFALNEGEKLANMDGFLLGDLVFCDAIVEQEAKEQGKNIMAHYSHLLIHGMLHLQGYDHQTENEAKTMEQLESKLMQALNYPDPYKITD